MRNMIIIVEEKDVATATRKRETAQRSRKKNKTDAQAETVTKRRYVLEVIATGSSMEAG